jgi:hypothetical protein
MFSLLAMCIFLQALMVVVVTISDTRGATGYSQVFLYMFFLLDFKRGGRGGLWLT